jgi:hypothetical protein
VLIRWREAPSFPWISLADLLAKPLAFRLDFWNKNILVNIHALLALLAYLHDEIAKRHPQAPDDSCWPTSSQVNANIKANLRYFPGSYASLTLNRRRMLASGLLEIGPCAAISELPGEHPRCEHWRLTEAGLVALSRMNTSGCRGGCKHESIKRFKSAGLRPAA